MHTATMTTVPLCQRPGCSRLATWAYPHARHRPVYCGRDCRRVVVRTRQRAERAARAVAMAGPVAA